MFSVFKKTFEQHLSSIIGVKKFEWIWATLRDRRKLSILLARELNKSVQELESLVASRMGYFYLDSVANYCQSSNLNGRVVDNEKLFALGGMVVVHESGAEKVLTVNPSLLKYSGYRFKKSEILMTSWSNITSLRSSISTQILNSTKVKTSSTAEKIIQFLVNELSNVQGVALTLKVASSQSKYPAEYLIDFNDISSGNFSVSESGSPQYLVGNISPVGWEALKDFINSSRYGVLNSISEKSYIDGVYIKLEDLIELIEPNALKKDSSKKNILYLEDDKLFADIMLKAFNSKNYSVVHFRRIDEALECLNNLNDVSLLLADYHLEDGSIVSFIEEFFSESSRTSIPAIVFTSDECESVELEVVKAGASSVISKRKDPSLALAYVDRVMNQPHVFSN